MPSASEGLTRASVELAARQWKALGVRLAGPAHEGAEVLDPEALILFTAALGHADARVRDESLDWCVQQQRLVSVPRLKNLRAQFPASAGSDIDAYFAVVNAHGGRWPVRTDDRSAPDPFAVSGKSALPRLHEGPALLRLQLRALFGVTARAELILALASEAGQVRAWSASDLTFTGYSKRNVALVLEELALSGLVSTIAVKNRTEYRIERPARLYALVPALRAAKVPRWDLRCATLIAARALAAEVEAKSPVLRALEARRFVEVQGQAFAQLGLTPPPVGEPERYFEELVAWLLARLGTP
jgi:hypothetical protein